MIEAKIVCDSIGPNGARLTTFVLTYPRFIHSEFMTHRMLSRNASSSRAIPVKKQIQMVIDNPVIPLAFTKNQKGMQGGEALSGELHDKATEIWLKARDAMADFARQLADLEVHKQYANRLLEPFAHITVVTTATDWNNFFALRIHPDAQPEIHMLAYLMYGQYFLSQPTKLEEGQWHLPFVDEILSSEKVFGEMGNKKTTEEGVEWTIPVGWKFDDELIKRSVARCARVSYLNHDGTSTTVEQDLGLYDRLVGGNPIHASPTEHQGMASSDSDLRSGNLHGFVQYRKTLTNENITEYKP